MRVEVTDNPLTLCDSIVTIIWEGEKDNFGLVKEHFVKVVYHHGDYDEPITLDSIRKEYPTVRKVISESGLHGEIYSYGNHGDFWEQTGTTEGYA